MFIKTCSDRIHPCEEIMCNTDFNTQEGKIIILKEAHKVTACLRALKVYVEESDKNYSIERSIPAHERFKVSCFIDTFYKFEILVMSKFSIKYFDNFCNTLHTTLTNP